MKGPDTSLKKLAFSVMDYEARGFNVPRRYKKQFLKEVSHFVMSHGIPEPRGEYETMGEFVYRLYVEERKGYGRGKRLQNSQRFIA